MDLGRIGPAVVPGHQEIVAYREQSRVLRARGRHVRRGGAVERVQQTILEKRWRPSSVRGLVREPTGLTRDLPPISASTTRAPSNSSRLTREVPHEARVGVRMKRPP